MSLVGLAFSQILDVPKTGPQRLSLDDARSTDGAALMSSERFRMNKVGALLSFSLLPTMSRKNRKRAASIKNFTEGIEYVFPAFNVASKPDFPCRLDREHHLTSGFRTQTCVPPFFMLESYVLKVSSRSIRPIGSRNNTPRSGSPTHFRRKSAPCEQTSWFMKWVVDPGTCSCLPRPPAAITDVGAASLRCHLTLCPRRASAAPSSSCLLVPCPVVEPCTRTCSPRASRRTRRR